MASIRIHQDIYNFEVRRKGFTRRQIAGFVLGVVLGASMVALLSSLGVGWRIAATAGLVAMVPAVLAGWLPVYGMPAEEATARLIAHASRGPNLLLRMEQAEIEKEVAGNAFRKKARRKGFECEDAKGLRKRIRAERKSARK